jgi:hypothetical protein
MIVDARLQCHHALQVATRIARAYLPEQPDDRHTNFGWEVDALFGHVIPAPGGDFQAGLQIAHLALWIGDARLVLDGLTLEDAIEWAEGAVRSRGLDPAAIRKPLHFTLPAHPVADGARFAWHGYERQFEELASYYALASDSLDPVREKWNGSPVRCWPHHFDIATLIDLGEGRSVGAGMSPGDEATPDPYFYVNVWPYPKPDTLPALTVGRWNTEGWTGAVLQGRERVGEFLESAASSLISIAKD